VYIHPALGLRLAQSKIEEARSRAYHASARHAASLDGRVADGAVGTRGNRWSVPMLATVSRSRARRASLGARPPRTTKG
jgi:hypothetical protein